VTLSASEYRAEADNEHPVTEAALGAATTMIQATVGQLDRSALVCRIQALRIREHHVVPIDPPPPLGARLTPAELEQRLEQRAARRDGELDDGPTMLEPPRRFDGKS
jgi:hypothetical protein